MLSRFATRGTVVRAALCFSPILAFVATACSTPSPPGKPALLCTTPGQATPGPMDNHCQAAVPVSEASCHAVTAMNEGGTDSSSPSDAGQDDGAAQPDTCAYGPTVFGTEADDDDCKYHLKWSSPEICQGSAGTTFTVMLTKKQSGLPVTDLPPSDGILVDAFIPKSLDASCDVAATHFSLANNKLLATTTAGLYAGRVVFDAPGEWTVRFHIHEDCTDVFADSPHGHAAFHVTVN